MTTPGSLLSDEQIKHLDDAAFRALRRSLDLEAHRRRPWPKDEQGKSLTVWDYFHWQGAQAEFLLARVKERDAELRALLEKVSGHWTYCDPLYRFYHHSLKVYHLQESTLSIRDALQALMPERAMNDLLTRIIEMGTGHVFRREYNEDWLTLTLPITTAFFNVRFFLEMGVRCTHYESVKSPLGSDLAALLYLFNLR